MGFAGISLTQNHWREALETIDRWLVGNLEWQPARY